MNAWLPLASYPCGNFSDIIHNALVLRVTLCTVGHSFILISFIHLCFFIILVTRAVPNIRFVFASAPNSGPNRLFVFGRTVLPRPNTNSA